MNLSQIPFLLPLLVMATGLALGFLLTLRMRRGTRPEGSAFADAQERAGHYISQLKDLENQVSRLDDAAYAAQKARYEGLAAAALREAAALRQDAPTAPEATSAPSAAGATTTPRGLRISPQLAGALWGGGIVAVVALLLMWVSGDATVRSQGMSATGSGAAGTAAGDAEAQPLDTETQALVRRLQQNPLDVAATAQLTQKMLGLMRFDDARALNARALQLDPENALALVHKAVLVAATGDAAAAAAELDRVMQDNPNLPEGWFFRGMLAMQQGQSQRLRESWEKYLAVAPDGPRKERIRSMLAGATTPGETPKVPMPPRQASAGNADDSALSTDALLEKARTALKAMRFDAAQAYVDRVFAQEPAQPRARVYNAMIKASGGSGTAAIAELESIIAEHPHLADAWFFRGMLAMRNGDRAMMQESFQKFIDNAPDDPRKERVRAMLARSGSE